MLVHRFKWLTIFAAVLVLFASLQLQPASANGGQTEQKEQTEQTETGGQPQEQTPALEQDEEDNSQNTLISPLAAPSETPGWYKVPMASLKYGTDQTSVMANYLGTVALLEIKEEAGVLKKYAYILLKNSDWIKVLRVGTTKENRVDVTNVVPDMKVGEVIGDNKAKFDVFDRIVKFEVGDLTPKYEVFTHIKIPSGLYGFEYDYTYDVHFQFGSTLTALDKADYASLTNLNGAIADADSTLNAGQSSGVYGVDESFQLENALSFAKEIARSANPGEMAIGLTRLCLAVEVDAFTGKMKDAKFAAFDGADDYAAANATWVNYLKDLKDYNELTIRYLSFAYDTNVVEKVERSYGGNVFNSVYDVSENTANHTKRQKVTIDAQNNVIILRITLKNAQQYVLRLLINPEAGLETAKTELDAVVVNAEQLYAAGPYGIWNGQYSQAAKDQLRTAIDAAKKSGSWLATTAKVVSAKEGLQTAVTAFGNAVISGASNTQAVTLKAIHATSDFDLSSMNNYFEDVSATLEDNKTYITLTINDHKTVTAFKTAQSGTLTAAEIVSTDTANNKRTVKFPVADIAGVTTAQVHISTQLPNGQPYERDHDIRLIFNRGLNKTTLDNLVKDAEAKLKAAKPGSYYGYYSASPMSTLQTAIDAAKAKGTWFATQAAVDEAATAIQTATTQFGNFMIKSLQSIVLSETGDFDKSPLANEYFSSLFSVVTVKNETDAEEKYFQFTLKKASEIQLKVKQNGEFKDVEITNPTSTSTSKTARFKSEYTFNYADELADKVVEAEATVNGVKHKLRILLHSNAAREALDSTVTGAQTKLNAAVVGSNAGQYPQSAVDALSAAIQTARTNGTWFKTQADVDAAKTALDAAVTAFNGAVIGSNPGGGNGGPGTPIGLADGKYMLNFRFLKFGTSETSVMDEYLTHPARMLVENGVKKIMIKMKQSNEITSFTVGGSTPATVESNAGENTRRVEFVVADLTQKLSGHVKVDWPAVQYHHEYDVQIEFGAYTKVEDWGSDVFGTPIERPNPGTGTGTEGKDGKTETGTGTDGQTGTETGGGDMPVPQFKDTANHWAGNAIDRAAKLGIVTGYANGEFKPSATVNRIEFTAMISRALKLEGKTSSAKFADADQIQPWARAFVEQATAAGIIGGFADNTFRPTQLISRAEISVMIVRALGLPLEPASSLTFADAGTIPSYAKAYVATAAKLGLITGIGDNKFGASLIATRAEAVTLILRAIDWAEANQAKAEEAAQAA